VLVSMLLVFTLLVSYIYIYIYMDFGIAQLFY
jgi:hypothetical protein